MGGIQSADTMATSARFTLSTPSHLGTPLPRRLSALRALASAVMSGACTRKYAAHTPRVVWPPVMCANTSSCHTPLTRKVAASPASLLRADGAPPLLRIGPPAAPPTPSESLAPLCWLRAPAPAPTPSGTGPAGASWWAVLGWGLGALGWLQPAASARTRRPSMTGAYASSRSSDDTVQFQRLAQNSPRLSDLVGMSKCGSGVMPNPAMASASNRSPIPSTSSHRPRPLQ
mmetsp:Transcript_26488/g.67352  ORF Transcript_26488/g.67352 Transcript_26488/m.67352 type:complete len:230 (-) Transcript_26488:645-1334(-)